MAAPALRAPPLAPGSNGGTLTLRGGFGAPPGAVDGRVSAPEAPPPLLLLLPPGASVVDDEKEREGAPAVVVEPELAVEGGARPDSGATGVVGVPAAAAAAAALVSPALLTLPQNQLGSHPLPPSSLTA